MPAATSSDAPSAIYQHAAFFDRNHDGLITPWETYQTLRDQLGCSIIFSLFLTFFLHLSFSYPTLPTWVPDPFFTIHISRIHKCCWGSNTGIFRPGLPCTEKQSVSDIDPYVLEQQFGPIPQYYFFCLSNLQGTFCPHHRSLSCSDNKSDHYLEEIQDLGTLWTFIIKKNQKLYDFIGSILSLMSWYALYHLCNNSIKKQDIIDLYQGSLFPKIAKARNEKPK